MRTLSELAASVRHLYRHRRLTWELARKEFADRYVGQVLGSLWMIGHPLMIIGVYVLVFGFIFKTRVGGTVDLPLDFTTYLLAGLIPWLGFQEAMGKSCQAITSQASLVKQVVFPIEVLPVKGALVALITQLISTTILFVYVLARYHHIPATYALLPVVMFFQFLLMVGVSFLFAAVGVYFRDLKDFVQVFTLVAIYLMPICYLPAWVPGKLRPLMYLNPFSYMIWCYQDILYFCRFDHLFSWAVFLFLSALTFFLGYAVFSRLKPQFGSVL
jgi:lipopolysaccharide transport system permease protein